MKYRNLLIAPIAVAALLLSACAGGGGGGDTAATPNPDVPQELVWAASIETTTASLDPAQAQVSPQGDAPLLRAIYGQLLYFDADNVRVLEHLDSIEANDDFDVWTLTLKDGITFSDGTPFDADALKFGLDRHSAEGSRSYVRASMAGVKTEVTGPLTVEVTLPTGNANFDRILALAGYIGSPTAIEADPEAFKTHPIGAGPFVVENWVVDNGMQLVRNEDYYGTPALLDRIDVRTIKDAEQIYNSVLSGEVQATRSVRYTNWATLSDSGYPTYQIGISGQATGMYFQVRDAPFDDIRAREAVAYALDLQALTDVFQPGEKVGPSFFAEGSAYAVNVSPETNDPKKAQALFDELADEGKPLVFEIMSFQGVEPLTEAIQSQLSAFDNVTATIKQVDYQAYAEAVNQTKAFQFVVGGVTFADPEPWIRDTFGTGGFNNKSAYSDKKMDEILAKFLVTSNDEDRKKVLAEFQEKLASETIWLKLADYNQRYVTAENIGGATFLQDGVIMLDKLFIE